MFYLFKVRNFLFLVFFLKKSFFQNLLNSFLDSLFYQVSKYYTFIANLAFALLLLELLIISSCVGIIGFFVIIFSKLDFWQEHIKSLHTQILLSLLKIFFIILSSKE